MPTFAEAVWQYTTLLLLDRAVMLAAFMPAIHTAALEQVFHQVDEAVLVHSNHGALASANAAAARLFGFGSVAELLAADARSARFQIEDERGNPVAPGVPPSTSGAATDGAEHALVQLRDRAAGHVRWVRMRTRAVHDEHGALDCVVTTLREAPECQRSIDELRISHAWFSTMLKSIGDAVIATDCEGHIEFVNHVAEDLTGWPIEDAKGLHLKAVFHIVNEETRVEVESPVTKVIREGAVVGLANRTVLVRRDGRELAIDDSGAPIRDAAGRLVGVVLVFRDVTAKRREEKRRLFLGEASAVLASSLDYAMTLRTVAELAVPRVADWCTVQMREDDGSIRLLAYAHVERAKAKWLFESETRYPPAPSALHGVARVLRTGKAEMSACVREAELREWSRDDDHLQMLERVGVRSRMIVPMRARARMLGAITFGCSETSRAFDDEDLVFAEQLARASAIAVDNARLHSEAQEASRTKDEFLATVSHELRTPLNAILGWTRMMRLGPQERERRERGLLIVERNARAQARLVDDLLDVSRIVSGKLALDVRTVDRWRRPSTRRARRPRPRPCDCT